jgi:phosphohistidine phosphatase
VRLLAVRHGEAGGAAEFAHSARPDHLRPLTAKGRKRMWLAARRLVQELPSIDVLGTSPYLRAVQTAEIISSAYGDIAIRQLPQLACGAPLEPLLTWLTECPTDTCVAIVGHAPELACLITYLAVEHTTPVLKIKKRGACLVSFKQDPRPGTGLIRWLMDAQQLGKLAI